MILSQVQQSILSEQTLVTLGTAFAVLAPISAGAAFAGRWLFRRFERIDSKLTLLRNGMRRLHHESAETWCAHMMENWAVKLKAHNPTLDVPEVNAAELIARARQGQMPEEEDPWYED